MDMRTQHLNHDSIYCGLSVSVVQGAQLVKSVVTVVLHSWNLGKLCSSSVVSKPFLGRCLTWYLALPRFPTLIVLLS